MSHVTLLIALVLVTCCVNVVLLEALFREAPSAGNVVTAAQFLFVAFEGLWSVAEWGRRSPQIPVRKYLVVVALFFLTNVANNLALNFRVSVPLHIIFRSGSLLANMLLGVLLLGRRYSLQKTVSVALITVGIILATLASATPSTDASPAPPLPEFLVGVSLLLFALLASARLGLYQEQLFRTHGKHAREAVFYQHFLALPGLALLLPDLLNQWHVFQSSARVLGVPRLWLLLLLNTCAQFACIQSVMLLMASVSSLAATLVLTVRKCLSLLFSVIYFNHRFSRAHWTGAALVFFGSLLFLEVNHVTSDHVITVRPRLKARDSEEEN